jgi:hypothetical protein
MADAFGIHFRRVYGTPFVSHTTPPLKWRAIVRGPGPFLEFVPAFYWTAGHPCFTFSDRGQGIFQVVVNVFHVFDSYGDADQAIGDSDFSSSFFSQCGVSHGGGVRD